MRRSVSVLLIASCLTVAGSGCGKVDPPSAPQGTRSVPELPSGTPASDARQGDTAVSSIGGFSIAVAPSTPSRIAPPSVSVKSPPGQGASILEVRWFVNGEEQGGGQTLSASQFKRGDRIHAVVKLRAGGEENLLKTIEVVAANALPDVADLRIEPEAPANGRSIRAIAQARDPDGDPLTLRYQWKIDGVPTTGETDSLILRGAGKGAWVHVTATPNDGFGDGAWRESPSYQVVNSPPVVRSAAPTSVPPSLFFRHTIVAEDPDGDPVTYRLSKGPGGMTLSGSTLEWQVPEESIGNLVEAVVTISDDDGGQAVHTLSMTIRRPGVSERTDLRR